MAAELLTEHGDLKFIFVGDGSGKAQLLAQAEQKALPNVQFIPFQSRQRLPKVLASADIALITLKKGIGAESLPYKTFSALASGRPVIASLDEGSETWNLIQRAQAGLCVPPENPEELVKAILTLKGDPALRERMGLNGRAWAEQHHSPQAAAEKIEQLLKVAITKQNFMSSRRNP